MATKQKKGIDVGERLKRIFKGGPYEPEVTKEFERKDLSKIQMEPYEREKETRREMKEKEEMAKKEERLKEEAKTSKEKKAPKKGKPTTKNRVKKEEHMRPSI